MRLVPRDLEIIRWVARMKVANAAQIGRAFGTTFFAMRQRCGLLIGAGLLRLEQPFHDQRAVYLATREGCGLAGCEFLPGQDRVQIATLRHSLAVVSAALELLLAAPGAVWVAEREVRADRLRGPEISNTHIPDGVLVLPDGSRTAVEVDLSAKAPARLARIVSYYGRTRDYAAVRWFAAPPAMAARLQALSRGLPHISVQAWTVPAEAGGGVGGGGAWPGAARP